MTRMQLRTKAWFGDEDLTIDFPASWKLVEIGPRDEPALTVEAMRECLSRPIGTRRLSEIARGKRNACLLYTSDAADERSSVDLGGRRIIKQNKRPIQRRCVAYKQKNRIESAE